jgi:hypothetical protein
VDEEHGEYVTLRFTFSSQLVLIKIDHPRHRPEHDGTVEQRQAQIFQTQLSPAELAHQETLIQEREAEIREIETGIHELHEIFRDLGTIVQEQGDMLGSQFIRDPAFLTNHVLLS